jgi:hypothetical protein
MEQAIRIWPGFLRQTISLANKYFGLETMLNESWGDRDGYARGQ